MATVVEAVGIGREVGTVGRTREQADLAGRESVLKNVLLFFAAPFIGLAYIVAFPLVGAAALVKIALR